MSETPKKGKIAKRIAICAAAFLAICAMGFFIYTGIYYHADSEAIDAAASSGAYANNDVEVRDVGGKIAFIPKDDGYASPIKAGFIFYPGGKVEAQAYAPLMQDLARQGVLCVICPMPFNLAVFDVNAANGVIGEFPEAPLNRWFIGGHSLGGSMAALYARDHASAVASAADSPGELQGVVLLGSYSTTDLRDTSLRVLCIYGSEDGVMNRGAFDSNLSNLPSDAEILVLAGGNHAGFGSYGAQSGDGKADISPDTQWQETADAIVQWMDQG